MNKTTNETKKVNEKKPGFKKYIGTVLIIVGLIIVLIPIVGKIINQRNQEAMLKEFYLEVENKQVAQAETNTNLDEALAWGSETANQEEIAQNTQAITEGETETAKIKKMPTPIGTIKIDAINVKLPIAEGVDLETLKFSVGHMPESASLGSVGNSVLAGHRSHTFGAYFNRLDEVKIGDKIVIEAANGTKSTYEVYETLIVDPKDTSVLNTTKDYKVLTLITCHPEINPTGRLIVHAMVK